MGTSAPVWQAEEESVRALTELRCVLCNEAGGTAAIIHLTHRTVPSTHEALNEHNIKTDTSNMLGIIFISLNIW